MILTRFMKYVDKNGPLHPVLKSRCWLWTAAVRGQGYGGFWMNGKPCKASRASYILHVREIPVGQMVLHKCNNRLCVNPVHLYAGTHQDNMDDRNRKGRQASGLRHGSHTKPERRPRGARSGATKHPELFQGEKNGRAFLTENDVREIRNRVANGEKRSKIAKEKGITWRHVNAIVKRDMWKCVS